MFLNEMVSDLDDILTNGIEFKDKTIAVTLRCVVYDAPAKAMVKKDPASLRTLWLRQVCYTRNLDWEIFSIFSFQDVDNLPLWTDMSYRRTMQQWLEENGTTMSPFCRLPLDMIAQFPIDYMHQCCLGLMKKLGHLDERRARVSQA